MTTTTTTTHRHVARWIDRHFAREISVADETALRAHLPGCTACRARYERHLLLARLDRQAPTARQRLARGLGLRVPAPRRAWGGRLLAAAAMAAALLLVARARQPHDTIADGFGARGNGAAGQAFLWVYRISDHAAPRLAGARLRPDDDLAFAYANPAGKRYLSIFAVDEHAHIYWYYPAWPVGAPPPAAVPARPGPGPHELPEAVRHPFDGRHLEMYALFSDEPLGVAALERRVAPRAGGADVAVPPGALVTRQSFEVGR